MPRTPDDLVRMEVHYCVSSLVYQLAGAYGEISSANGASAGDLASLTEQAAELSWPIDDYEEAAIQAGWRDEGGAWARPARADEDTVERTLRRDTAQEACDLDDIEPYQREVFEHWIVSDWLADQLDARGEKVDKDFAGMIVWARTCSGQGIAADSVIEVIAADLNREA